MNLVFSIMALIGGLLCGDDWCDWNRGVFDII